MTEPTTPPCRCHSREGLTPEQHENDCPATTPPVDTDLRDRIRRAICEASGFTWLPDELMEPDEYGEHADAVLAVLPAPAEVCICGHPEQRHFEDCCQVCDCGTFLVPEAAREMITHLHAAVLRLKAATPADRAAAEQPADRRARYAGALRDTVHQWWQTPPRYDLAADAVMAVADTEQQELRAEVERLRTDRATVLREGSDAIDHMRATMLKPPVRDCYAVGLSGAAGELRRLADEAQQPETEAHEHVWTSVPGNGAYARLIGHTWTYCGICGQQPAPAPSEEPTP